MNTLKDIAMLLLEVLFIVMFLAVEPGLWAEGMEEQMGVEA